MQVSQKCQYALRSVYELARRRGGGPWTIRQISEAQDIPPRFLELILSELRRAGLVESRRGKKGGYRLAVGPEEVTVGQVIRLVDGQIAPGGPDSGNGVFGPLWRAAAEALTDVYERTTFQDLVDRTESGRATNYDI